MQPKLEGRFSDGRDFVSWTGDSISMGETLFRYRVSRGRFHISQGETLFLGRLYFVTPASFIFQPVTIETMGRYNPSALFLLEKLAGAHLQSLATDEKPPFNFNAFQSDRRETTFLFQRLSICIQRYNLIAFKGAWREEKPMADV